MARYAAPDFAHIHQELKRKGVTLQLLWEEYAAAHAGQGAYRYSQFCLHYRRFARRLKRSMRQVHRAGEKLFIDYSGDTRADHRRSHRRDPPRARSSWRCWARRTTPTPRRPGRKQLPDWIASHVRCFEFLGGGAALLVPDNLKSAINRACRYEPEATSTYAETGAPLRHRDSSGTAVSSARQGRRGSRRAAWCSAGSWRAFAIVSSSRSKSSTPRSANCSWSLEPPPVQEARRLPRERVRDASTARQ